MDRGTMRRNEIKNPPFVDKTLGDFFIIVF